MVEDGFEHEIVAMGMTHLPIEARHAAAVGAVTLPHRDPFDQLLVAQAQVDGLRLLTADKAILSAELPFIINARKEPFHLQAGRPSSHGWDLRDNRQTPKRARPVCDSGRARPAPEAGRARGRPAVHVRGATCVSPG